MTQCHSFLGMVFLVILLIFPLACCDATSPATSFPEYERVLQNARKDGKPVMLYFSSKYCPYCALMEQFTLADKDIRGILAGFHVVKIDAEKNAGLARLYAVGVYPSFWFLEGSGKRIMGLPGYVEKPDFKKILEYVKGNHYKTRDLYQYLRKSG